MVSRSVEIAGRRDILTETFDYSANPVVPNWKLFCTPETDDNDEIVNFSEIIEFKEHTTSSIKDVMTDDNLLDLTRMAYQEMVVSRSDLSTKYRNVGHQIGYHL